MASQNVLQVVDAADIVRQLHTQLNRPHNDKCAVVLLTCGIAGSGKTTLAKQVLATYPNFKRLSNDEIIASRYGICGVDYEVSKYDEYQDEADGLFNEHLEKLLVDGKHDVIIDRSLYAKEDRDNFKSITEKAGARWVLVYFKVSPEVLWKRIIQRREKGIDANSALDISEDLFGKYVNGFEHPEGEGEIVVEYTEV